MTRGTLLATLAATSLIGAAPLPPLASYGVDVATTSGFGAGMAAGRRPGLGQILGMLRGGGTARTLELRLSARNGVIGTARHIPPSALGLGPQLPLLAPEPVAPAESSTPASRPSSFERPRGRMLIFWGCGEHVGPGQPQVIDFAKMLPGQISPEMMAMAMSRGAKHAMVRSARELKAAHWPNRKDSRLIPASGSLIGPHRVEASYAPPIGFSLGAGQDFMPALDLREAGALPSGGARLGWTLAPQATGYALSLFGAGGSGGEGGDLVLWSSASTANHLPDMDYLTPAEVRRQVARGMVLAPAVSQCVLPAEVARAAPAGMITMIGYGPEISFADSPRAPKWDAKLRYKSSAMMIRGLNIQGDASRPGEPPRRKRRLGLGDVLRDAIPIPRP